MAAPEILKRLETRAAFAEELLNELKIEVAELKRMQGLQQGISQVNQLQEENSRLKMEIEKWKSKLTSLEMESGINQIALPGDSVVAQVAVPKKPLLSKDSQDVCEKKPPPTVTSTEKGVPEAAKDEKDSACDKKKKKAPVPKKISSSGEEPPVDVSRLDLRVGRIVAVKKHPDADSLYVEEVDVGEAKPRTVVSGLVKHVSLEEMQDRMVVLLCNLKPAKMRGVTSEAMVMCASSPDAVEILDPPTGAAPGDIVVVEGFPHRPDPVLNPKKKVFETVAPDLKTNHERVATYKGSAFSVLGKGVVSARSLINVNIK